MPYKTRDQMIAAWAALATTYPTICSSEVIGQSVENRDLKLFKIGNPLGGRFAIVANIHGEEKANVEIVYSFAEWVITSSDADAVRIRERNLLLIVPMLCIDEYDIKSPNHNNVNLNDNFDYDWGTSGSGDPAHAWLYRGPSAASEPETQTMMRFFENWLPKHQLFTHDGSSGYHTWYMQDIHDAEKVISDRAYLYYKIRALRDGRSLLDNIANTTGGGANACAYHHYGHKIIGWAVECFTDDPVFDTIASTHYPNMKPLFIALAQKSELAADPQEGPAVELTFGSVEPADSEVSYAQAVLGCTEEMRSEEHTSELQSRLPLVCR